MNYAYMSYYEFNQMVSRMTYKDVKGAYSMKTGGKLRHARNHDCAFNPDIQYVGNDGKQTSYFSTLYEIMDLLKVRDVLAEVEPTDDSR